MSKSLTFRIANISISIEGEVVESDLNIPSAYRLFVANGKVDIRLRLHREEPDIPFQEKVFACPPVWTLFRHNGISIIKLFATRPDLKRTLVLQPGIERADLYFANGSDRFLDPFHGPTMELLLVNYLARGRGVIIHGCAVDLDGRGLLFVGESGAGKSTLARMWDQEKGVEVLSDDRTIVRKQEDEYWMYGTPWHGEAQYGSPRALRLERIFFLRHGPDHSIKQITGIEAVSKFLTCSFPPYWNPQAMEFTMELFSDLTAHIPCEQLTFKPERSIVNLIEKTINQSPSGNLV
ncbi:MAG: hypothetical protein JSV14_16780 [Deltaproteobacteria bacterium]|nr:MAG: hypothetical protein JSV14_16780 [Deltaproteobacteria bacterium]